MFTVSMEAGGLMTRLSGIALRSGEIPKSTWESVASILFASRRKTFAEQGRPGKWPPSLSATREGRQTLVKTGALLNDERINSISGNHVEVAFGASLGKIPFYLQFGTGAQVITKKQRGFFWYKFLDTGESFWKAMALSKTLKGLPARRHVRVQDEDVIDIMLILKNYLLQGK